jgi:pyruvate formate lyase activating enzyme
MNSSTGKGLIFKISRCSTEDGPGIRTTVFFKGCPLRCIWCHSPQSQRHEPEVAFYENRCIRCGACVKACPENAQVVSKAERTVLWDKCNYCGECVKVCPTRALDMIGSYMTVREVIEVVKKDIIYYKNSGGGVTFSGGEPAAQPRFLTTCLKICKEMGIHTAVETCGFVKWPTLEKMIPLIDLFLYDVKLMDNEMHKRLTGVDNELILENLKRIDEHGKTIWIRVPLITGCNDSIENIRQTAEFASTLKNLAAVSLLPYNTAAGVNYLSTGRKYELESLGLYDKDRVSELAKIYTSYGIKVRT